MINASLPFDPCSLVLASTSRYRAALLKRLGWRFDVSPPQVDETPVAGESPLDCALRLALAKALAVAQQSAWRSAWVIGSDQTATLDGARIIGKPGTHERAREQLRAASGQTMHFHTGLALVNLAQGVERALVVSTEVRFRLLGEDMIERYLLAERPYDCAGSAKSEGMGIGLLEAILGPDPSALIGLPLIALSSLLLEAGFQIPGPVALEDISAG
jgi:septum formation protein